MIYSGGKKQQKTAVLEFTTQLDESLKRVAVVKLIFNCTSYAIWEFFSFILDLLTSFGAICM